MGPIAGVEYNLTLIRLESQLQHMYHGIGQPYARVDLKPYARADFILRDYRNLVSGD